MIYLIFTGLISSTKKAIETYVLSFYVSVPSQIIFVIKDS